MKAHKASHLGPIRIDPWGVGPAREAQNNESWCRAYALARAAGREWDLLSAAEVQRYLDVDRKERAFASRRRALAKRGAKRTGGGASHLRENPSQQLHTVM